MKHTYTLIHCNGKGSWTTEKVTAVTRGAALAKYVDRRLTVAELQARRGRS